MFTGLIQAVGNLRLNGQGLLIEGYPSTFKINLGDSVSVNGVCLTASSFRNNGFIADVSEETLNRTSLREKALGNGKVNLELALRLSDRLGGHLVTGHVDGLGRVISIDQLPKSWILEIELEDRSFSKHICEKASICLDGISLTVANCKNNGTSFEIAIIPHTWSNTSLKYLSIDNLVNLETDIMAKYVEKILLNKENKTQEISQPSQEEISDNWLISNGWG